MEKRQLGIGLTILGVIIVIITVLYHLQMSALIDQLMIESGGTCFTETGECLHESYAQTWLTPIGVAIGVILAGLGVFLFFGRIPSPEKKQSKFDIMLEALSDDERMIMTKVKDEEGVTQATLKYRTGMSKPKLSSVLKEMEKKNLITREAKGNTYKIFLKKR